MFEERKVLNQVTILQANKLVAVQWLNEILKDGKVISSVPHRCTYSAAEKERFISEVEGAEAYVAIIGW